LITFAANLNDAVVHETPKRIEVLRLDQWAELLSVGLAVGFHASAGQRVRL